MPARTRTQKGIDLDKFAHFVRGILSSAESKLVQDLVVLFKSAPPRTLNSILRKALEEARNVKRCLKCNKRRSLSSFRWRNMGERLRDPRCKSCRGTAFVGFYKSPEELRATKRKREVRYRQQLKSQKDAYLKDHPCVDCGETRIEVLEFDHVDPKDKYMAVSSMVCARLSWKRVEQEIQKCQVRCKKCHIKRTTILKMNKPLDSSKRGT